MRGASQVGRVLLLALLPIVAFLVLGEITLRLYLRRRIFYDVEMARYARLLKVESPNPRIGHVHRPGSAARLMGVDVRINRDGFRDADVRPARDGARRIVVLGDSLTFGWGVDERDSFPHLLEKALDSERPTEVINFGTGNYNTTQEVELFLDRGLEYDPDEVVVFYFINDAEPVPKKSRLAFLADFRIVTFYWSRMKKLAARLLPGRTYREYYAGLYRDDQPGWIETRAAFRRLAQVCHERGITLKVILLPELHVLDDYPFAREHELVAEFLRANGIPVLDLAPSFRDVADARALWVSEDDAHPNALAHRRIAGASRAFLAQEGALP